MLMRWTNLPLALMLQKSGFADQSHLISVLRRETGETRSLSRRVGVMLERQHGAPDGGAGHSSSEDLRKLSEQRSVNIQRRDPELGRKYGAVIDPGLQSCGPVDVGVLNEHLAEVAAPLPTDLPGCYPCHTNGAATEGPTATCIIKIAPVPFSCFGRDTYHSVIETHTAVETPRTARPTPRSVLSGKHRPRLTRSRSDRVGDGRAAIKPRQKLKIG